MSSSSHDVPPGYNSFQDFLDQHQYSKNGILRFEKIYGQNFVSTGGRETTEEFVKLLNLQPGQLVIDVGCGIGGSAFYMDETFGTKVNGIDLSKNMIQIAEIRKKENKSKNVNFEVADATMKEYPDGSCDVVYSRDTILHIKDKKSLFERFWKWLAPGGKLLISDYCCKESEWSQGFINYVNFYGYHLLSTHQYGKVLESVGFVNVRAEDKTDMFVGTLKRELAKAEELKHELSGDDYTYIVEEWTKKVKRCANGEQKWGLFYAEKPSA